MILDCGEQNMYTVAVKSGVIGSKYARNQFHLCPQKLLTCNDVNTQCTVTLRQAVKASFYQVVRYFFGVIVEIVKNNVKQTGASALRLVNCARVDSTTVLRVRINSPLNIVTI
jgi:hypothetical protein